jgi:hypothetical protein
MSYMGRISHNDPRRELRTHTMFAVCNYGSVWEVFHYRRDALAFAKEKWQENRLPDQRDWKDLWEIRKIEIRETK